MGLDLLVVPQGEMTSWYRSAARQHSDNVPSVVSLCLNWGSYRPAFGGVKSAR